MIYLVDGLYTEIGTVPKENQYMINTVESCLNNGKSSIFHQYTIRFLEGTDRWTRCEVTIPRAPSIEKLIDLIRNYCTYGKISFKICRNKYNPRFPFRNELNQDSYTINVHYNRGTPYGSVGFYTPERRILVEKKLYPLRVSQMQCMIQHKLTSCDFENQVDWLVIVPGIYPGEIIDPNLDWMAYPIE